MPEKMVIVGLCARANVVDGDGDSFTVEALKACHGVQAPVSIDFDPTRRVGFANLFYKDQALHAEITLSSSNVDSVKRNVAIATTTVKEGSVAAALGFRVLVKKHLTPFRGNKINKIELLSVGLTARPSDAGISSLRIKDKD